ncbi:MAG: hypothetical protein GEV09_28455, partial [Pseudonocardiaceae bacterium]|nr:hypothetical protein [Pseudonocardiaceae bacterium]
MAVTGARKGKELAGVLERRGARALLAPTLDTVPPASDADLLADGVRAHHPRRGDPGLGGLQAGDLGTLLRQRELTDTHEGGQHHDGDREGHRYVSGEAAAPAAALPAGLLPRAALAGAPPATARCRIPSVRRRRWAVRRRALR